MHSKFHEQIDNKVSTLRESTPDKKSGPRVPTPPSYGGSADTETFERWLNSLLRWLRVGKVCGSELDSERIEYTGMYLEGTALSWFEDNVDGVYRRRISWTFKDVITGLYDRFIHDNATHDAADNFAKVKYETSEGVMSYYHKLERYATRMIRAPDRFTFKTQLLSGLPSAMVSFIFEKGGLAEASSMEMILYFAWEAEEIFRKKKRYQECHHLVDVLSSTKDKDLAKSNPGSSLSKPEHSHSREQTKDLSP